MRTITCIDCHKVAEVPAHNSVRCVECQKIHNRTNDRVRAKIKRDKILSGEIVVVEKVRPIKYKPYQENERERAYVLVKDPTGDYRKGATFCAEELEPIHLKHYQMFAPGTLFRRGNALITVTQDYKLMGVGLIEQR